MTEVKTVEQQMEIQGEIKLPIASLHENVHIPRHVDTGRLSLKQGQALRQIRDGLDREDARLESGRKVITFSDAIRWALENVDIGDNHLTRKRGRPKRTG